MYAWQEIQVTLDYIEENYDKEIDIDKLQQLLIYQNTTISDYFFV